MLDTREREELEAHLEGCAECQRAMTQQMAMKRLLGELPFALVSPDFAERVRKRIEVAGWLDAVNWRTWTLRLAPVAAILALIAWLPVQRDAIPVESWSGVLASWAAGNASETRTLLLDPQADPYSLMAAALEEPSP
jgi:anti-sigma factor RsiW